MDGEEPVEEKVRAVIKESVDIEDEEVLVLDLTETRINAEEDAEAEAVEIRQMRPVELLAFVGSKRLSADHVMTIGFDDMNMSKIMKSALYVAMTRARHSLRLITASCNQALHRLLHGQRFVTLVLADLDTSTNRLVYSNAGHQLPLLVRSGPSVPVLLDKGGPVMGLLPLAHYEVSTVQLAAGDVLVLYTDGLVEAENRNGEQYGRDRLADCVRSCFDQWAEEIANQVLESVTRFHLSSNFSDDFTLLVFK